MTLIDDIYTNLNNVTFTNQIIILFSSENRKKYALKKIKQKYGSLLFNKYECLINNLTDIILENNISRDDLKKDIDFLFCTNQNILVRKNKIKPIRRNSTSVISNDSINNKIIPSRRNSTSVISNDSINNKIIPSRRNSTSVIGNDSINNKIITSRRNSTSVIGNNSINNKMTPLRLNSIAIIRPNSQVNSNDKINNLVKKDSLMK